MRGLALVLAGGGARAAYQAGVLDRIAEALPNLNIPLLTGVSAGAINAAYLANHRGTFGEASRSLSTLWSDLGIEQVFRAQAWSVATNVLSWSLRLMSGGAGPTSPRGLVDTEPLRQTLYRTLENDEGRLVGVSENLLRGRLDALAVTTTNYASGQAVTFIHGDAGEGWRRPFRRSVREAMSVDHVRASAAIPILFPAVKLGRAWHGDGGVRQTAPLSPAIHLGADRILAVSTLRTPSPDRGETGGEHYPPPAQILGVLVNSIFLDNVDYDAANVERINELCRQPNGTSGLRRIRLLVLRPTEDLGRIAGDFETRLPKSIRYMTRGWGTKQTKTTDVLATLMFESYYTRCLIELGRRDAEQRLEAIVSFLTAP